MAPSPAPMLQYETPRATMADRPRPVGHRALVAGATLGGVGAVAVALSVLLAGRLSMLAGATFAVACAGVAIVALSVGSEALFFRRNVADPKRAVLATLVNVCIAFALLALWRGLRG